MMRSGAVVPLRRCGTHIPMFVQWGRNAMASPSPEDAVLTANGVDHAGVAEAVERFFVDGRKVLFAGAGVSSRAGLPVWGDLVTRLAAKVADFEPQSAELMRVRAADGLLPESFNVFRDVVRAPQGSLDS